LFAKEADYSGLPVRIAAAFACCPLQCCTYSDEETSADSSAFRPPELRTPDGAVITDLREMINVVGVVAPGDEEAVDLLHYETPTLEAEVERALALAKEVQELVAPWRLLTLKGKSQLEEDESAMFESLRRLLIDLERALSREPLPSLDLYVVSGRLTLADVMLVGTLFYPVKFLVHPAHTSEFPCIASWFAQCICLPKFRVSIVTEQRVTVPARLRPCLYLCA
jgi:glutathione S-transferase